MFIGILKFSLIKGQSIRRDFFPHSATFFVGLFNRSRKAYWGFMTQECRKKQLPKKYVILMYQENLVQIPGNK